MRLAGNVLVLAVMAAWGCWLLTQARGVGYYAVGRLAGKGVVPSCHWLGLDAAPVASLGWSIEPGHAWSDRREAFVAVNLPALPAGGALDLEVISLPGESATLAIDGGATFALHDARPVRLPLEAGKAGPMLLRIQVEHPQSPTDVDRRWLGIALKQLRLVPAGGCQGASRQ